MSTETHTQPVPASRPHTSAIRAAGTAAAVGAAVTVWLLARFGAGMTLRQPAFSATGRPAHLAIVLVIAAATVASLAGWGVASLIGRTTRRPRATWVIIATAATVVSLSMPFSGHGITVTQRVALACMHVAVAAMLIPVLAATIRRSIARPGPALRSYPQVTPPSQPHRAPADPTHHLTAGGSDHILHRPARRQAKVSLVLWNSWALDA